MAIWDDPTVLWDDIGVSWDGATVAVVAGCPPDPEPFTADPFTAVLSSPAWIGDIGILIEIETFGASVAAEIGVYASRIDDTCPPALANPFAAYLVAIPAGVIFTIDGAAEKISLYDKAAKRSRGALRQVTPLSADGRLVYPTIGGPCRSACVVVDAGGADTDGAGVYISASARET